jgi:2-polyprenyl-3-methyl-5-hydroxy-6-metoxy-1,4-benzoquinol methylase
LNVPYDDRILGDFLAECYPAATDIREWLAGAAYQIDACSNCRLVYQRYVGSDEFLSVLYDHWLNTGHYPDDPAFRRQVERPRPTRDAHELYAAAHSLRLPISGLRTLDYGMGWGLWARIARALGAQSFGYDLSQTRCEDAARHGITIVRPAEFATLGAHFVNADQILEHTARPWLAIQEMASALRPGGILKVAVPQAADLRRRIRVLDWRAPKYSRNSLNPIGPLEHVNCFSPTAIEMLCARAGLRRLRISWGAYAAHLREPGTLDVTDPVRLVKGFLRPAYHRFSRDNLYAWFQK